MFGVTFEGESGHIHLDAAVRSFSIAEIYSAWKEWVVQDDNLRFLPAFRALGGDPIAANVRVGSYYFLQNQHGWRLVPAHTDGEVVIDGNLYPEDTLLPLFHFPNSSGVSITMSKSAITQVADGGGGGGTGGGGLSAEERAQLYNIPDLVRKALVPYLPG